MLDDPRRQRIVDVLVDASIDGNEAAAKRHRLSLRTVQRYWEKLEGDAELSRAVAKKFGPIEADRSNDLVQRDRKRRAALMNATDGVKSLVEEAVSRRKTVDDENLPKLLHSVVGAVKVLGEYDTAHTILMADELAADPPGESAPEGAGPDAGGPGSAAGYH
ncbi:MAG: hypothetical protein AAF715_31985 [Myxococcota bacterium]